MISEDVNQEFWELFHTSPPHDLYYPNFKTVFAIKTLYCSRDEAQREYARSDNGLCIHCQPRTK